jgi:hypothetical protein
MNMLRLMCAGVIVCGAGPTAREILGPASVVPLAEQPAAKIIVDPPLPDQLAKGLVVIQYRTENLRILPVFGPAALAISPRIGHLHVTVDDSPWHWADTSSQELIIDGLPPGPHKILIELANTNHTPLAQSVVRFDVPRRSLTRPDPTAAGSDSAPISSQPVATTREATGTAAAVPTSEQRPAKIVIDPPQPDRLARGVVFIQYRTENVQILPVFGPAALAVSPPIGHIHVTIDDAPWRWADASGGPLIVSDFPRGPHKIVIELANANHGPLAQHVVEFEVPRR